MPLTVAQLVARLTADTSGFYRGMAIANSAMLRSGGLITRVATGTGLAVAGMGILSVRAAGNFEQSMNILQAVTDATNPKMKQMSEHAIALGKDFKLPSVSAKDAADAMVELSKGGLSVNRVMGAARGTLQLGIAANIGFADSAKFVANALQAFELGGSQATRVANLLAAGANKSTAEISDLAFGMQAAGAQFHGARMPIEDMVASLSLLANRGMSGEYAGTALKTMLVRLTGPTKKAAEVMKDYGIELFTSEGRMKSMPQVIREFQTGLGGLTDQQREQALITIFGVRANQAMRILMEEGAGSYTKFRDSITGTTAAQKMAEAQTKGFNGALQAIGSAVETAAIQIGLSMLPALTSAGFAIANFIAGIDVQKIIDFGTQIKNLVVTIFQFVAAHPMVQAALLAIVAGFAAFSIINSVIGMIRALQVALLGLSANPIVLIAAALVALAAGLIYAYKHSEEFRNIVNQAFAAVRSAAQWVVDAAKRVSDAFREMWNDSSSTIGQLRTIVTAGWTAIRAITQAVWPVILAILKATWANIEAVVTAAMNVLRAIIQTVSAAIRGDWQGVWNGLRAIVSAVLSGIVNIIGTMLRGAASVALAAATAIGKAIWAGLKAGAAEISQLASWLGGKIQSAISSVVGMAGAAAAAIGSAIVQGVLSGIAGLAASVGSKIASEVSSAISWAKSHIGSTADEVTEKTIGKPIAVGIIRGFLLGIVDLPEKMREKLRNALEAGQKVVQAGLDKMNAMFSQFSQDALSAFDTITQEHLTPTEKTLAKVERLRQEKELRDELTEATNRAVKAQEALNAARAGGPTPEEEANLNKLIREREDAITDLATKQQKLDELRAKGVSEEDTQWQDAARAVREAQEAVNDYATRISDAQSEISGNAAERLRAAEAEVVEAQKALSEAQYNSWKYYAEIQAEEERKQYEARREQQKRHLQTQLEELQMELAKHPEAHKKIQDQIIALLGSYGLSYKKMGAAMGTAFAAGMIATMNAIEHAAQEIANTIRKYLKLRSPAEKGPLSDLNHWWDGFADTLMSGLDSRSIEDTLASMRTPSGSYAGLGALGAAGSTPTIVNVNVEGSVWTTEQLGDELAKYFTAQSKRGMYIPSISTP